MATSDPVEQQAAGGEGSSPPKKQRVEGEDEEEEKCAICWSRLSKRPSTTLGCRHMFHLDCIGSEFNIIGRMQCPTCRQVDASGNWQYWDNKLPADAQARRQGQQGRSNAPLHQPRSSISLISEWANSSVQGLGLHDDNLADPELRRRLREFRNRNRLPSGSWDQTLTPMWYAWDYYAHDSVLSDPHASQLDARDPYRRERAPPVDFSSFQAQSLDLLRTSFLSEDLVQSGTNRNTVRRRSNRSNQRRSQDGVSIQEQGQDAANLSAATGRASNQSMRMEAEAQRGQRVSGTERAVYATHNPDRIGDEMEAMTMAHHDMDKENPALEARQGEVGRPS